MLQTVELMFLQSCLQPRETHLLILSTPSKQNSEHPVIYSLGYSVSTQVVEDLSVYKTTFSVGLGERKMTIVGITETMKLCNQQSEQHK